MSDNHAWLTTTVLTTVLRTFAMIHSGHTVGYDQQMHSSQQDIVAFHVASAKLPSCNGVS